MPLQWNVRICINILLIAALLLAITSSTNNSTRRKSFVQLIFQSNVTFNKGRSSMCRWLKTLKHQHKMCMARKGFAEVLLKARDLIVNTCRKQFEFDQWNCQNVRKTFKKVYRETAFLHALSSAGLMFLLARSCSQGHLSNCKCAPYIKTKNSSHQWGGCGDNTRQARSFTTKFLQLKKPGDYPNTIIKYNAKLGLRITAQHEHVHCRCFGLSGSCTTKICYKKLKPFPEIARELKNQYHSAIQAQPTNSMRTTVMETYSNLLYLEQSPNFCPLTVGRECSNIDVCATLCCGRGFNESLKIIKGMCNCEYNQKLVNVTCEPCHKEKVITICK